MDYLTKPTDRKALSQGGALIWVAEVHIQPDSLRNIITKP